MVFFHQKQFQYLKKSFYSKKLSHSYFFIGEEDLGKREIAEEFVKLLNCKTDSRGYNPCNTCSSCRAIEKKICPDFEIIEGEKKEIKISEIRKICEKLNLKPYNSLFKTVIIDNAERLNKEAQNALLKTLEEPWENSILILISSQPEKLVPTIISRTQIIKFFNVSENRIKEYLKEQGLSEEKIKDYLFYSESKPGKIKNFLKNPEELKKQKKIISDIIKIKKNNFAFRFNYIKEIYQDEKFVEKFLSSSLFYFRQLLLAKLIPSISIYSERLGIDRNSLENSCYSFKKIKEIIKEIEKVKFLTSKTDINLRLSLELLMLKIPEPNH